MRIESDSDLVLLRLLMGAQPTLLIVAAAEQRLFDNLGDEEKTVGELAKASGLDPSATELCLDALVGLGLLTKAGKLYRNTSTSVQHLTLDGPRGHALRLWIAGTRLWERLPDILKTGRPPDVSNSDESWREDSLEQEAFVQSMYDIGWAQAQRVADLVELESVNRMVDLGGGAGHYAMAFLKNAAHLHAVVIDLPISLSVGREMASRQGLADRLEMSPCDIYDPAVELPIEPESVDLVLISHVLHMEGADRNADLVAKAARLLAPGGKILIHDMFIEENRTSPQPSSMFAVHMLAMTSRGALYPISLLKSWLENAGLATNVVSMDPLLITGERRL